MYLFEQQLFVQGIHHSEELLYILGTKLIFNQNVAEHIKNCLVIMKIYFFLPKYVGIPVKTRISFQPIRRRHSYHVTTPQKNPTNTSHVTKARARKYYE